MKQYFGIALLLVLSASAQIRDLAVTNDGSEIFFSATARPLGSPPRPPSNSLYPTSILHYRQGIWSVVESSQGGSYPNLSGDARLLSWIESLGCGSCMFAAPRTFARFSGLDPATLKIPQYQVSFSRNGRFAFYPGFMGMISPAVQDLETGSTWDNATAGVPFSPSQIADDGSLLGLKGSAGNPYPQYVVPLTVVRWRPNAPAEDIFSAPAIGAIALAAGGKHAIIEASEGNTRRLWALDLESSQRILIAEQDLDLAIPPSIPARISLSANGSRALFFWAFGLPGQKPQIHLWNRQLGTTSILEGLPEGVSDAILSPDGSTAWVATLDNRLLRFDLNQGTTEEVLSAFPFSMSYGGNGSPVPGSLVQISRGSPMPGQRFLIGDLEAPIVPGDDPGLTLIQLPWELASKLTAPYYEEISALVVKEGYPLELPVRNFVATNRLRIQFETVPPDAYPKSVKAFAGDEAISAARPARPGETVRVWFTGLGPLDLPVPTGIPGPSGPPARPLTDLACAIMNRDYSNWQGIETTPVIYAPGRIGLYQLDLKIPETWPSGVFNLACYQLGISDRTDALIAIGQ